MVYVHQEVSQVVTRKGASGTHPTLLGGVTARRIAFGGDKPKFDNLKVGYDNNNDDDIDDAGDDVIINETFTSSSVAPGYDHAGNLIDDGNFQYVYDAWNRLVKVRSDGDTDVTFQTAEFFADGRRAVKTVSNSGEYDTTEVYLYDGHKMVETRDGSNNVKKQFVHGTQYIDELLMIRVYNKGDFYVHQDANWNVIMLTDLRGNTGGKVAERYVYTPYGEVNVMQETSFGDRDGDEDVDSTDKGTVGVTCTGTVTGSCRILDLDFDGDYDSTDAGNFDSLPQGIARHPGKFASGVSMPFMHQGLLLEPEVSQYQVGPSTFLPERRSAPQRIPTIQFVRSWNHRLIQARVDVPYYSPSAYQLVESTYPKTVVIIGGTSHHATRGAGNSPVPEGGWTTPTPTPAPRMPRCYTSPSALFGLPILTPNLGICRQTALANIEFCNYNGAVCCYTCNPNSPNPGYWLHMYQCLTNSIGCTAPTSCWSHNWETTCTCRCNEFGPQE